LTAVKNKKGVIKMDKRLNPRPWAKTFALWSALLMLVLGILANLGIYTQAAAQMAKWHLFFSLDFIGIVSGMVEAAIVSYVLVYLFVWIYNQVARN
jgi:hypothetical protein